jgi:hypothetical protein
MIPRAIGLGKTMRLSAVLLSRRTRKGVTQRKKWGGVGDFEVALALVRGLTPSP